MRNMNFPICVAGASALPQEPAEADRRCLLWVGKSRHLQARQGLMPVSMASGLEP